MEKEKIILKKGKEKIVKQRHHWIFSGAIHKFPSQFDNGSLSPFFSFEGELLGHAYFNRHASLCGRIISFGAEDPLEAIEKNINEAYFLRKTLFDETKTNSYRLIHAEADFLPGLIVDKYADYLVIQIGTLGMERLKYHLLSFLKNLFPIKGIYEKSTASSRKEDGLNPLEETLYGEIPEKIEIKEEGLKFNVSLIHGQKTGFFLDQRQMRILVGSLSQKKRVLNAFSYTGGFSVYALKGGAIKVDSVDISKDAISMARENVTLNGFDNQQHNFHATDVFALLREQKQLYYDFVILDPPAFAKKKEDLENALRGYREINTQAMSKMPTHSLLLTCSCSYFVEDSDFRKMLFQAAKKAKREIKILSSHHQSYDHPINIYHRESEYLKGYLLTIGNQF